MKAASRNFSKLKKWNKIFLFGIKQLMASHEIVGIYKNPPVEQTIVSSLVRVAMDRVDQGRAEDKRIVQYFRDGQDLSNVVYFKVVKEVDFYKTNPNRDKEGLYIYGFMTGSDVSFEDREFWIILPKDTNFINEKITAELTKQYTPFRIDQIAHSLERASLFRESEYRKKYETHRNRQIEDADKMYRARSNS